MKNLVNKIDSKIVKAKDLSIHPLLKRFGLDKEDLGDIYEVFAALSAALGHYDRICVDKTMQVISNPEVLIAAQANDPEQFLEVDVLDMNPDDLMKFIISKNLFRQRSFSSKWKYLRELRNYLETNKNGIAWKEELQYGDINQTISRLTLYGKTHLKRIAFVGKYADTHPNENVFDGIRKGNHEDDDDAGKMSFIEMYNLIKERTGEKQVIKPSVIDVAISDTDVTENEIHEEVEPTVQSQRHEAVKEHTPDRTFEPQVTPKPKPSINIADQYKKYVEGVESEKVTALFKAFKEIIPAELWSNVICEYKDLGGIRTTLFLEDEILEIDRLSAYGSVLESTPFICPESSQSENSES